MSGETVIPYDDRVTLASPTVTTTDFTVDFPLFDDDDLSVYIDGEEETDFTVAATYVDGVASDAVVTLATGVVDVDVAIVGLRLPRRDAEFIPGSRLLTDNYNADNARLVAICQELYQQVIRSLRLPQFETGFSPVIPKAATRASKYLSFDSSGNVAVTGEAPSVQYQGAFASVDLPTTRIDGSALQVGDLAFDTTANRLKVWDGASWITAVDSSTAIDINGMVAGGAIAIGDYFGVYDIDAAGNRKFTTQQLWNSAAVLTALGAAPALADYLPLYDTSASAAKTVTVLNLFNAISSLTAITDPALADAIPLYDASAPGARSITFDNLMKAINLLTADASPDVAADYVMTYDASASAPKKVLLQNLPSTGTNGTATTPSGTTNDFTGIPAGVKRITLMLSLVSTNGSADILLQIGDSGGIETSSYTSTCGRGSDDDTETSGYLIGRSISASGQLSGTVVLDNISGNTWVMHGVTATDDANYCAGTKTLSGTLTQLRLTTVGGGDTFDGGTANIKYE